MSDLDLKTRWKVEAEYYDREYSSKQVSSFDPTTFYNTRPYGMKQLLDRVGGCQGKKMLEVGTGLGLFARYFAHSGIEVYTLDISFEALKGLSNATHAYNIKPTHAVAELLPFKTNTFDLIWGAAVLHHLTIPIAAEELSRVLKSGGDCFFYEPMGYNPVVNFYRKVTPCRRTEAEQPLQLHDLQPLQKYFSHFAVEYCHLLALIPQGIGVVCGSLGLPGKNIYHRIQPLEKPLAKIDKKVFKALPTVQRFAQIALVHCKK